MLPGWNAFIAEIVVDQTFATFANDRRCRGVRLRMNDFDVTNLFVDEAM